MSSILAMAILSGATSLTSLGVGIAGSIKLKTHHDPTRQGLKWVPASLIMLFLGTLLLFVQSVYNIAAFRYYSYTSVVPAMIGYLGSFFITLSTIGLFMALLETSFGILTMWNRAPRRIRGMRTTMRVVVTLLLLLALVTMVGQEVLARGRTKSYTGVFGIVGFTREALSFVAYCWALGMSILVSKRSKVVRLDGSSPGGENILSLFHAAVAVAWFGSIWFLIYLIVSLAGAYSYYYDTYDAVFIVGIAYTIINFLTPLVSLILLFVLGQRQQGGLWTNSLPKPVAQAGAQQHYVNV